MIMKLKKQRPWLTGAVEPMKKIILSRLSEEYVL
jgi:hypothetical protein